MELARQRSFHHMRYVVAVMGFAAVTFLTMLQLYITAFREVKHSESTIYLIAYVVGLVGVILTGVFMKKLSAKRTIVAVILLHSLLLLSWRYLPYIVTDIFIDFATMVNPAIAVVSMHALISSWSPPAERPLITSIIMLGSPAGYFCLDMFFSVLRLPVIAFIIMIIAWTVLWIILVDDSPQQEKNLVSTHEKNYIQTSIENYWPRPSDNQGLSAGKILISKEFILVALVQCTATLIHTAWARETDFSPFQHRRGSSNVLDQTLALIVLLIVGLGWGAFMTIGVQRKILSYDLTRKISSIIPNVLGVLLYILMRTQPSLVSIPILSYILYTIFALQMSGPIVNIIDIAPNFAPLFMAIFEILNLVLWRLYALPENCPDVIALSVIVLITSVTYWVWGSTAQKSSLFDRSAGEIHLREPLNTQPTAPVKV